MSKKLTKNQQKIFDQLWLSSTEITAQDLHIKLKAAGHKMGLATVYRTLKLLKIEGKIQERVTPDGESFYSKINAIAHHYHHLNCVSCGKSYPVESCPLNQNISTWCHEQKFKVYYHTLEFFGLCENCQIN